MKRWLVPLLLALALLPFGLYFSFLKPLDTETLRLRRELDQALQERESSLHWLESQAKQVEVANRHLDGLRPFDLSKDPRPDSSLVNRSTIELIDFSRLLEQAGITVDSLSPLPTEYRKISLGGIAKCRYRLKARGPYRGMIGLFQALRRLPANFEVCEYQVAYRSKHERQAIIALELLLSFNFLLSPAQLDQASQSIEATASLSAAERFLAWLDPPAFAQPLPKQFGRVEPFLPLDDTSLPPPPIVEKPLPAPASLTLLSIMFGEAEVPRAIVRLDGRNLHVQPGSRLPDGRRILAIGEKDILVDQRGVVRRFGFEEGGVR